ncbi:helix-turn-helix domain-containing protein [Nonomuraea dietziae]|uniref:helix-turn-helix domain-containing protein n=1 Tax=Nonomuraea dietziae TaxID=65515 RepID=UPI00342F11B4
MDSPANPVSDVETLKALSHPTRLAILRVLTPGAGDEMPVRTVKELSAELGQPVTKLYRHINMLESRGLIEVAASRLVSGIAERSYRACQVLLYLDASLLSPQGRQQSRALDAASFDRARDSYLAAAADSTDTKPLLASIEVRLTPERYLEFQQALRAMITEFSNADDPAGRPVGLFCALHESK